MVREEEIDLGVLNKYLKKRYNANKNWLNVTTGSPGSGKSYADLRACEVWYEEHFNEPFPIRNCCFSVENMMDRLTDKSNRPGEMFILEEAGTLINSKDFQSKINKLFNFYMQSFRCKNLGLMFNLPLLGQLDKSTRLLVHSHFITSKIIKTEKVIHIKPFFLQVNQDNEKVYRKYLRKTIQREGYMFSYPVKMMAFGLPSKTLLKEYEKLKEEFVETLGEDVKEIIKGIKGKKKVVTYRMKQINTCYHKFGIKNTVKIAEKISELEDYKIAPQSISQTLREMDTKWVEWRENPKIMSFVGIEG